MASTPWRLLLGPGRKDESGDFTKGAGLSDQSISRILNFTGWGEKGSGSGSTVGSNAVTVANFAAAVAGSPTGEQGVLELDEMAKLIEAAGYGAASSSTPPSYAASNTTPAPSTRPNSPSRSRTRMAAPCASAPSRAAGGMTGWSARFRGEPVPATGFSIGVSRLLAALKALGKVGASAAPGPVVVLVMDKDQIAHYQAMVASLRNAGIRAEMYMGGSGMKAQMKYADKRGAPCVVIQGSNEREAGEVQIKDLVEGAKAAAGIAGHDEWKAARPAQFSAPEAELVERVREVLARHAE